MKPFLWFLAGLIVCALALRLWEAATYKRQWQCDAHGYVVSDGLTLGEQMDASAANLRLNRARIDALDDGPAWLDHDKLARADLCP